MTTDSTLAPATDVTPGLAPGATQPQSKQGCCGRCSNACGKAPSQSTPESDAAQAQEPIQD